VFGIVVAVVVYKNIILYKLLLVEVDLKKKIFG
jgi:hypothetical protein